MRSDTVVLVRIAELNVALIKRALDIGADGVVIPWIETAEQLRTAVSFAHYPPSGVRGIGAERATAWGQCMAEHTAEADSSVMIVPIIETVEAGRYVQSLLSVDGVEMFFLGSGRLFGDRRISWTMGKRSRRGRAIDSDQRSNSQSR